MFHSRLDSPIRITKCVQQIFMPLNSNCLKWVENHPISIEEFKTVFKKFLAKYPRPSK